MIKIIFVHLYNDASGSPQVLNSIIKIINSKNINCVLCLGSGGFGILQNVKIPISYFWYRKYNNKFAIFFAYVISQFSLFLKLFFLKNIDKDTIIYVNTLLPFAAAIFGRITGRKVIYHLHELSISPKIYKNFLIYIAENTANFLVYVSNYHYNKLPIRNIPSKVVYNALEVDFTVKSSKNLYKHKRNEIFNILILSSLRNYKGIPELITLANSLLMETSVKFTLVANANSSEINDYFKNFSLPPNLVVKSQISDPSFYYKDASLVINLSRPDLWVETFGLTILEGMSYGIPVIAPPIGGPCELVNNGIEGFLIDSRDTDKLIKLINKMTYDEQLCINLSNNARVKSLVFSAERFEANIMEIIL